MEEWIVNLLIPFIMIGLGTYFYKWGLQTINPIFGYRTNMSMKNKDTWHFAHHYCGKIWLIWGFMMLVVTVIILFFDLLAPLKTYFVLFQTAILVISIIPVELALKKTFDKKGQRRIQ